MIYQKKVSVGQFAKKGEDYKDGDIVTLANEGKQVEGKFGVQDVFLVKLANGTEKNINVNQTSLNNIIDAYGSESKHWVGKELKIFLIRQNVQGKIVQVTYLAHPHAELNDDGEFVLPSMTSDGKPVPFQDDDIKPEDIPF